MPTADDRLPDFEPPNELLPTIVQEAGTGRVLMLAWMNRDSYAETVRTGQATFFSRSRQTLWRKGEISGHRQQVASIQVDCDGDTILLIVRQEGVACHMGFHSCFYRKWTPEGFQVHEDRIVDPSQVYPSEGPGGS